MTTPARKPKVELLMDDELFAMIDAAAKARFQTRSAWIIEASMQRLERDRSDRP
jgi:uncharacterized protein (DUF1778 family)